MLKFSGYTNLTSCRTVEQVNTIKTQLLHQTTSQSLSEKLMISASSSDISWTHHETHAHHETQVLTANGKITIRWNKQTQTLKQACFQGYPKSTIRVQVPVRSRNSAIQNAYRTSLRPSSVFEPRHPSLKVVSIVTNAKSNRMHKTIKHGSSSEMKNHPTAYAQVHASKTHTPKHRTFHIHKIESNANDPSAGSPTETLLRLLLPLDVKVH